MSDSIMKLKSLAWKKCFQVQNGSYLLLCGSIFIINGEFYAHCEPFQEPNPWQNGYRMENSKFIQKSVLILIN